MPLRIFIIILLLWTGVPAFADAARLTMGVAPGAVRDADLELRAKQLAAELSGALGDEVSVRLFDNPLQLGQWLNPYAMIELGMVEAAFLAAHPGKFLLLGSADPAGRWLVITRQGASGDFSQRVAAALSHNAGTSSLVKSPVTSSSSPATGKRYSPSTGTPEPVLVKSPVPAGPPAAAGKRSSPSGPAVTATPLTLGLLLTSDGLLRTTDQAKQFTAQIGRWLGEPLRARLFTNEQSLVKWFHQFGEIDLALIDEPGRSDPLAGNYRPLQRLVTADGRSSFLVSRQDLPETRLTGVLQALAAYGHDPSLEEILAAPAVKPSATPAAKPSAVSASPLVPSAVAVAVPAVVVNPLPVLPEPPIRPRLPEAPLMPSAPIVPVAAQPVAAEPPAPVVTAEPPAPVVAAEPPAPVVAAEPPAPVVAAEPPAPVVAAEPPAPVVAAEPPAPVVAAEPPAPVEVVKVSAETVAAVPEPVTETVVPPAGEGASPPLAATSDVPEVIAQPDLPQELRPPGVPQPRPGRLPEAEPPVEEPTILGKLQDLFGRTPKPPPLLPPPDPEPGVVYVVPFITLMVPAEVRERAFDQFVDTLNQRGGEQGLKFVILKQGFDKIDRDWLSERKYVLGEIYGYVEESGCCSTDLRTRSRVTFYRAYLPDPALKYEYPVRMFFDHDQSSLPQERQKLADQIAGVLAGELLKVLQP